MMSSGVGRGRGWLNLEKKIQNPGGIPSKTMDNLSNISTTQEQKQYATLIYLLQQIDPKDDGIILNKKFKAFLEGWEAETKNYTQVEESFKYIYIQCLKDYNLTKKFILVFCMFSFHKAEVHGVRIKKPLLQQLQSDFENRTEMRKLSLDEFRNLLCMLSAVYNKGHVTKYGSLQKLLGSAVLDCLDMLLDSGTAADLELFTSQLWINVSYLKQHNSEKLEKTLLRVRQLLIENNDLTTKLSRIWLLLALDIVNHQVTWQPSKLYSFYQEELGDGAIANLQEMYSIICNGLFVTPNDSEELATSFSNSTINNHFKTGNSNHEKLEFVNNKDGNYERIGRPILGVGAQLTKTNKEVNATKNKACIFDAERR